MYITVNRLVKEKGVYDVLYGWKMYLKNNKYKNLKKLLIIGKGPEEKNLKRLVEEWGLIDQVIFISYLPNQQVRQLYKHAKALLLGSYATSLWQEQFGYVLAEAIINQCPIITTASGVIPEIVENAGIIVQSASPIEITKALINLDDSLKVQSLKHNACRVAIKFEIEQFRNRLQEIYLKLVQINS